MWFKELSLSLRGLNAYIDNCEQISHRFGLLHGDLLNIFDIAHPVTKGIDDLDVLDVWESILGVAKIFHVVSEALIMLLVDGLQGFSYRWTLIHTLEVFDEHGT
jgi:hypothetical protein